MAERRNDGQTGSNSSLSQAKVMLSQLRVPELLDLLCRSQLSRRGRKKDLMDRIVANLRSDRHLLACLKETYLRRMTAYANPSRTRPPSHFGRELPMIPTDVKLKPLVFYPQLDLIIRPSLLRDTGDVQSYRTMCMRFTFQLTESQASRILAGRSVRELFSGKGFHYATKVQLRICPFDLSCEQKDKLPYMCAVEVNDALAEIPDKKTSPVDITPICNLTAGCDNSVRINWNEQYQSHSQGKQYVFQLSLVLERSASELIVQLRSNVRNADYTRAMIKDKLKNTPDSEVATMSLKVSLVCPLGKMKMRLPCRGSNCTHLQCFDGESYIQMNERRPLWQCPVCDNTLPYTKLIVDGYFVEILSAGPDSVDIEFGQDGSWNTTRQQHSEAKIAISETSSVKSEEGPCLQKFKSNYGSSSKSKPPVVIDLTELSSDDEGESAVKSPSNRLASTAKLLPPCQMPGPPPLQPIMSSSFLSPPPPTYYNSNSIPFLDCMHGGESRIEGGTPSLRQPPRQASPELFDLLLGFSGNNDTVNSVNHGRSQSF